MFDWQAAFNVALILAGGGIALYIASVKEELKTMKHDYRNLSQTVMNLREDIPRRYATIDDLNMSISQGERTSERIFNALVRIENKLDQKADK